MGDYGARPPPRGGRGAPPKLALLHAHALRVQGYEQLGGALQGGEQVPAAGHGVHAVQVAGDEEADCVQVGHLGAEKAEDEGGENVVHAWRGRERSG